MNSGPGNASGCFVHEKHHHNSELPRFAGWWGHNKERRFLIDMTAQVYIVVDSVEDKLVVSTMATRFKPSSLPLPEEKLERNEAYVWVKDANGKISPRKVTLGISNNICTEIISGLNGDENIILSESLTGGDSAGPNRMPRMR